MQSTGHSSMHDLSSTSTQGCAMMYVTCELLFHPALAGRLSAQFDATGGCRGIGCPAPVSCFGVPLVAVVADGADPVGGGVCYQPASPCPARRGVLHRHNGHAVVLPHADRPECPGQRSAHRSELSG